MGEAASTSKETTSLDRSADIYSVPNRKFLQRSHLRVVERDKMTHLPTFLLLTVCSPLIPGKPQYGAAPVQTPETAPFVQTPSQISCITTQETIWDTQYIEKIEQECHQEQIQKFRQACQTVYKNSCQTVNKQVCTQQYRQESQPYTETECSSQQKTDCESRWEEDGYGGKKWVEVPSTCQQNTYDTCQDVQKQKLVQVPYTDCQNVPQQQCTKVPQQQCQQEPYTASQQVCDDVHRKIPQRVSRTVPKKTCGGGGNSAPSLPSRQTGGSSGGGYRSGSTSNELVFTGALGNSNLNVKTAPQTKAGGDAINFG